MQQVLEKPETAALILRYMGKSLADAILATPMFAQAIVPALAKGDWLRCSYTPDECIHFSLRKMQDFQVVLWLLDNLYDNPEARTRAASKVLLLAAGMPELPVEHGTVQALVAKGGDINVQCHDGRSALTHAMFCEHKQMVRALLALGARVASSVEMGCTPLHIAADWCDRDIMELLLKAGADVNESFSWLGTPLHSAAAAQGKGAAAAVELLLSWNADVDVLIPPANCTPLYYAAFKGNLEVVQLLLAKGARRDLASAGGITPLGAAIRKGRLGVAELLLAAGANIEAAEEDGGPPLIEAVRAEKKAMVDLLLRHGANIEAEEHETGDRPLHKAALRNHVKIMEMLLNSGADVDGASPQHGRTPLYYATKKGNLEAVQLLLARGARRDAAAPDGSTLLSIAEERGHDEVAGLLRSLV